MSIDMLKGISFFVLLLLLQVLVFNHIHLFGFATPLLYVYVMLLFRRNFPKWAILCCGFLGGLCVDIFSNTPGLAAASMTFIGLLQPYVLMLFLPRESADDLQPSMRSLGVVSFLNYALLLVFLYCIVFFTLESFSFFNWMQWLKCVVGSTILTLILLLTLENMRKS